MSVAHQDHKTFIRFRKLQKKIIGIIEPKNSPKINLQLPKTNIKIYYKNEKLLEKNIKYYGFLGI